MFAKTAIVALFAGLVAGQAAPKGDPAGNPITRPLNEIVPACKEFTITWQPTTPNAVRLVLLKGPSTNVIPIQTLVTGISNSGSYKWTPDATLDATTDNTGYGLQLIDEITGQYQYSTQFGISKGAECNSYVAPSSSSTKYGGGYPTATPPAPTSSKVPTSSKASHSVTKVSTPPVYSTGAPIHNSTVIQPSKPLSVPSSLIPSATSGAPNATRSSLPESTGAASSLQAGLGLAGALAAFAFML